LGAVSPLMRKAEIEELNAARSVSIASMPF
jgi:hypothetical protein